MKGYVELKNVKYQKWIDKHVPTHCQGTCLTKAKAMSKAFPELRVVGVQDWMSGHAWCVSKRGKVADPTAHQFDHRYNYNRPTLEISDFPVGKCPWCGQPLWKDSPNVREYLRAEGSDDLIGSHTECYRAMKEESLQ